MSAYLKFLSVAFYENFFYRANFLLQLFTSFLQSYAMVTIWFYIMSFSQDGLNLVIINRTIKYMTLVSCFTIAFKVLPDQEITKSVNSGDIVRNLLLPVKFPYVIFLKSVGNILAMFIIQIIPIFGFLTVLYGLRWELDLLRCIGLIVGFIIGIYLFFLINLGLDILAFWLYETSYFKYIKSAIIAFFSGRIAPLWFYPKWLLKILDVLPFRQIYYNPISYYLEEIDINQYLIYLLTALIWILLIQLLVSYLWKRGIKKTVLFGG